MGFLKNQAKKMKLTLDKHFREVSVGKTITIRIPVPNVDKGKGNSRNILAIVLEITKERWN